MIKSLLFSLFRITNETSAHFNFSDYFNFYNIFVLLC